MNYCKNILATILIGFSLFLIPQALLTSCSSNPNSTNDIKDVTPDSDDSIRETFEKTDYSLIGRNTEDYFKANGEVVLYELDGNLVNTGREFTTETQGNNGFFSFEKVSLKSPYVLIKMSGQYGYYDEEDNLVLYSRTTDFFAIADLRLKDTVYFSKATAIEAFNTIDIANDEKMIFENAQQKALNNIVKAFNLDTSLITKPFSRNPRNNPEDMESKLLYLLDYSFYATDSATNHNLIKNGKWVSDSLKIKNADRTFRSLTGYENKKSDEKMVSDYFASTLGFEVCRESNRGDSVKVTETLSDFFNYVLTCEPGDIWVEIPYFENDRLGWTAGHDAEIRKGNISTFIYAYDSIAESWINATIIDSVPCVTSLIGAVTKKTEFTESYYFVCQKENFWDITSSDKYVAQQKACLSLIEPEVKNFDYIKKFVCKKDTSSPDTTEDGENQAGQLLTLLEREQRANPCDTVEEFRKGVIDTTIYYHCYKGEMTVANAFDLAIGRACNQDNKGYYRYQNSIYNCNGFRWSYASDSLITDSIVDSRDNQVYKTVGIGTQIWMAENLRYDIDSSWCYNDSTEYCQYGKIYQWNEVIDVNDPEKNICPDGWHVPNNIEFDSLITFAQSQFPNKTIQKILGATKGWEFGGWNDSGADLVGFGAYPLGHRTLNNAYQGKITSIFLCSADHTDDKGYIFSMNRNDFDSFKAYEQEPRLTCNIRCLKD
ncbi:MAG: hypothetical protein MJZ05_07115 [Fibrobacter sp.]|nr:hypothetical protein [Fibrobacter sp.]